MPQDALNSFRYLLEKVPDWIADLQNILDNTTQRQNELLFANQPTDPAELPAGEISAKASSLTAGRLNEHPPEEATAVETDDHIKEDHAETATPTPALLRPQIPHMTESDVLRLSQRKRKTFSACSRDESGPSKYRSRSLAVVYYDGDVQSRFADLVRAFNYCRNDIRRSKLSARVDTLARSGSSSSGSISGGSVGEDTTKSVGTYKTARMRLQEVTAEKVLDGNDALREALDKVDGLLEKSQSLCEHAAYQVLRDGDCALEVTQAKQSLEQAKFSAEQELPGLEKLAADAEERRITNEERQRAERLKQPPTPPESEKLEIISPLTPTMRQGPLEVDEIEVDDDEDETDAELEMVALKLPPNLTKYSMRSTRLTAC